MHRSAKHAFTLIELLIVVAIIAILAAIAVPNFLEAQVRSKVSRVAADQRSLMTAIESYRIDNNRYNPSQFARDPTKVLAGGGNAPVHPYIQRLVWVTTPIAYMTSIPNDPFAPEVNPGTGPHAEVNKAHPVYVYWDDTFIDIRKNSPVGAVQFRDMPQEYERRGSVVLVSFGPDRGFEAAKNFSAAWPIYDPTNGTISDGDIFRFSGSGTPR